MVVSFLGCFLGCFSLVDRLVHHSEILQIDGNSYRAKEARERNAKQKRGSNSRTEKERSVDKPSAKS
ncbi:MAG: ATP-binding protein [Sedimenticola sp.]